MKNWNVSPYLIVLSALTMLGSPGARAQDNDRAQKFAEKAHEKFNSADLDHDGLLTKDEAAKGMPRLAKHFDEIDANHDGKLSWQEVSQYAISKRAARDQ
jgi:Ca2+-binding EF-hand superfamily protein